MPTTRKRGRGRPPLADEERRARQYRLRLTEAEHELIEQATELGIVASEELREGGLARLRRAIARARSRS